MKHDRLDQMIQGLFDGTLTEAEKAELNVMLKVSGEARARYRHAVAIHAALDRIANGRVETGAPKIVVMPKRTYVRGLAVAAALVLAAGVSWWMMSSRRAQPVASLAQTFQAKWGEGMAFAENQQIPPSTPIELLRGVAELKFPSGAEVTLEGPCRFELHQAEALTVAHGRVSVHAPSGAEGFRIDTPGGKFVDKGTRFGLAVGNDGTNPVVLTEIYEGEVEVLSKRKATRLHEGDSRALIRDAKGTQLLTALDADPVSVPRINTETSAVPEGPPNLALGKPVTSPGYCIRPHGSVFPPEKLTDGRTDDSGVPGDWSFWLAPSGENGEFTVDLLNRQQIARISLQNTKNRSINDRGTKGFQLWVSDDNVIFTQVLEGELPRISANASGGYPFHDFRFAPRTTRYVKIVVTSHYRHPNRAVNDTMQSGGMSEIRIFAE